MIQLLKSRILLNIIEQEDTGIIRPDNIESYQVYKVGKDVKDVKKGDKVLYDQGRKLKINNKEYILTDEDNIIVIL